MRVSETINTFLLKLSSDGLKSTTLLWYSNKLTAMSAGIEDGEIVAITNVILRGYIAKNLHGRDYKLVGDYRDKQATKGKLSIAYIRGHIRAMRVFWAWASREYTLPCNPMEGIALPRNAKPIPKAISDEGAKALLMTCDDTPMGVRDRAILLLLLDTGARAAGIRQLSSGDINWNERTMFVYEKGDKGRIVYFSEITEKALKAWLAIRPRNATTIFCSLRGNDLGASFKESGLNQMLERRAQLAKIAKPYNPHAFRHSFARRWLRAKGDPSTLALVMGHATTRVTMEVYAVFLMHEAAHVYRELQLMERLLENE